MREIKLVAYEDGAWVKLTEEQEEDLANMLGGQGPAVPSSSEGRPVSTFIVQIND